MPTQLTDAERTLYVCLKCDAYAETPTKPTSCPYCKGDQFLKTVIPQGELDAFED